MKEKATETVTVDLQTFHLEEGWYTIAQLEEIVEAMKATKVKARKALERAMRKTKNVRTPTRNGIRSEAQAGL